MKTNLTTLVVLVLALALFGPRLWHQPWTSMRITGAAIGLPSLALFILARIQLGGSFSARAEAQSLVTHGLYSRIRNPIYVFGGLFAVGACLFAGVPKYLWLLAMLIPLQIYRVRNEEQVLAARFGDEYWEYKAQTWI